MIWHFFEVWFLLLGAFVIGCGLGAALYAGLGNSALSTTQGALADSIGDTIDGVKARFGLGPDWRDGFGVRAERPVRRRRRREPARGRDAGPFDDADFEAGADALSRAVARRGRDRNIDRDFDFEDEDDYGRRGDRERDAAYADEAGAVHADALVEENPPAGPVPVDDAPAPGAEVVAKRPAGLLAPRNGVPDHLQRIRGVGKGNEELLNSFGIFHFGQIASWTPAEARGVASQMPFPERIERDDWIGQATVLASGGDTGYVKSAERRRARRASDNGTDDEEDAD